MSQVSDKPVASFSRRKSELRDVKSGGALRKIGTGITVLFSYTTKHIKTSNALINYANTIPLYLLQIPPTK